MNTIRTALAALAVAAAAVLSGGAADATPTQPNGDLPSGTDRLTSGTRPVALADLAVIYAERAESGPRLYVELNNAATYLVRPCPREDSRRCFWDAGESGNADGVSFVRLRGVVMPYDASTAGGPATME